MSESNGMKDSDHNSNAGLYKRIAKGLERQPAYLLVFAVSALFVLTGVVSSGAAIVKNNIGFGALGLVSFALALLAVVVVVREVERNSKMSAIEEGQTNEGEPKGTSDPKSDLPSVVTPRLGKAPTPLTDKDERKFLAELSDWSIVDTEDPCATDGIRRELYRAYEFRTFESAFSFMNEAAERAVRAYDHHPRWQNTYNRVEVWLTTFNLNYRPSTRDTRLARKLEEVWEDQLKIELKQR